jgi:hypothetical protein
MDCFKLRKSKPVSNSFSNSLLPGFGFTTERAKNLRSEAEPIFLFVVVVVDDDDQMLKLLNSETLKLLLLLPKISTHKSKASASASATAAQGLNVEICCCCCRFERNCTAKFFSLKKGGKSLSLYQIYCGGF